MSLQDNLKRYREDAGFTSKEFSKLVGISYTTYTTYENRGSWPNEQTLCKISDILNVSVDELLGHEVNQVSSYMQLLTGMGFTAYGIGVPDNLVIFLPESTLENIKDLSDKGIKFTPQEFVDWLNKVKESCNDLQNAILKGAIEKFLLQKYVAKDKLTTLDKAMKEVQSLHGIPPKPEPFSGAGELKTATTTSESPPGPPATKPKPKRTRKPKNEGNS